MPTPIRYDADGLQMQALMYGTADETERPGILVFPEAFGLGDHAKLRAERIASLGYRVLAADFHGEGRQIEELSQVMELLSPLQADPLRTRARALGALEALRTQPGVDHSRIAAIGYCFGGTTALELARSGADIKGVVGFHSGLATRRPEDARAIRASILVCVGADDPSIDANQRATFAEEMTSAGIDWQMNLYGGVVHSFTDPAADARGNPDFLRYDARADRRSWSQMIEFLGEIFA